MYGNIIQRNCALSTRKIECVCFWSPPLNQCKHKVGFKVTVPFIFRYVTDPALAKYGQTREEGRGRWVVIKVGDGQLGFSYVYKVTLSNGVTVAIKKLNLDAFQGLREFRAEMETLARQIQESRSHVSTQVAGSMGYMPPEYREGNTTAMVVADVYSYGILMIEIATQNRPSWPVKLEWKIIGRVVGSANGGSKPRNRNGI
ncbi:peroxidase 12-like [Hibiscus syriacus]|uniref:Peroxidase 12-like n=1 Tax=Hibiscus syriacus TaxID=106335 RepID=A0A6A3BJS5_HIBSY|nr:peroxidase 12-like [Hibiscus syriacus]